MADASGQRVALPGRYTARFGLREAAKHGMGYAETSLTAAMAAPVEAA